MGGFRKRSARLLASLQPSNQAVALEEIERRRLLLALMLVTLAIFLVIEAILSALLGLFTVLDLVALLVAALFIFASYSFSRLKQLTVAGYLFITGAGLALLIRSLDTHQSFPILIFNYLAVTLCVVSAGLIINEIVPFFVATVAIGAFSFVFAARTSIDGSNLVIQIILYGALFHYIIATLAWSNARTISQAFRRQDWQNQELLKVNRLLENNITIDGQLAGSVSQLSFDLSTISREQSKRAFGQAQSVAIVTSTLEELSATARQIAEVAESVFTASEQALHTAETGGRSVGLSIDSIAALTTQVEGISNIANELGGQSRRISEIVETITDLAEETNLLALNATIEAAGAGEYGRRFAVVASEVQMLANRSRAASRDVQTILGQIRALITDTLQASDEGLNVARRMSEIAGDAGEAIEQIIETVESTTFLARQINLTTQQQRSATDQAVDMIRQVADTSQEAAAHAQQLQSASDRLNDTAIRLRRN